MFSNRTKTAGQNHLGSIKLRSFHFHHMVMFSMIALLMCGSFGCRCVQTFQAAYVDGPIKCYRDRIWAERFAHRTCHVLLMMADVAERAAAVASSSDRAGRAGPTAGVRPTV